MAIASRGVHSATHGARGIGHRSLQQKISCSMPADGESLPV